MIPVTYTNDALIKNRYTIAKATRSKITERI